MASNYYFWQNTGYFDAPAELQPLMHTWSLAVEEQFYLFYPLLLLGLGKFSHRTMVSVLLTLFVASLIGSEWSVREAPSAGYYLLHSRAWEMLLGGLICFLPVPSRVLDRFSNLLSFIAMGTIVACGWFYEEHMPFPGLTAMVPCGAAALLIYVNSTRLSWPGRLLSLKPVVFIGLISYSLYLIHWPVLAFLRYEYGYRLSPSLAVSALVISLVLAGLSWRFIEQPFRKRRWLSSPRQLVGATIAVPATLILLSSVIHDYDGLPQRVPERSLEYLKASDTKPIRRYIIWTASDAYETNQVPVIGDPEGAYEIAVWGDSHAMHLLPGIDQICQEFNIKCRAMTFAGCPPLVDFRPQNEISRDMALEINQAAIKYLKRSKVSTVLMVAMWSSYANRQPEKFQDSFRKTIDALKEAGISIVLIEDVGKYPYPVPVDLARRVWRGQDVSQPRITLTQHRELNRLPHMEFLRAQCDSIRIYDPAELLMGEGADFLLEQIDGIPLYMDGNHLSVTGAMHLKPLVKKAILESAPQTAFADDSSLR